MSERTTAIVCAVLVAVGPISMALYTPAMPELVRAFETDLTTVKLTLAVYFGGFALTQLLCGPLSDAFGRRPIVISFIGIYVLGSLMAVFAPSIEWLLAARAIQGTGAAAGVAVSRAIVRDLFTGTISVRIMNAIGLMLAIGPAISPTLGGITLDLLGWHAIFVFMLLYGASIIALFLTIVPETLPARDPDAARPGRLVGRYATLLSDPRFLRPSLVIACTTGGLYALATMLPFVLIDEAGLTPTEFGLGMLAQTGSYMFGTLCMRQLLKAFDAHRLVPFGLASVAVGGLALAVLMRVVAPSYPTVMVPVGFLAFGIAFVMPATMTDSLAPFGRIAGAAAALTGFMQMAGGLAGSAVAALIGDAVTAIGTVIPGMALIAIGAHVGLKRPAVRREMKEQPPEQPPAQSPAK